MIELCNLRQTRPSKPYDVKVDRSSLLGNPFKVGNRQSRCKQYADTFEKRLDENPRMKEELRRLYKIHREHGQLRLFCWCVPLQCHSETIKKFLEQYI